MTLHDDHMDDDIGVAFEGGSLSLEAMSALGTCWSLQHRYGLSEGSGE